MKIFYGSVREERTMKILDDTLINIYKETSKCLTGNNRRVFQAKITEAYLDGNARRAEFIFGWARRSVELGIKELKSGYICYVEIHERGDKRVESKLPQLRADIEELVDPYCQTDPKFRTNFSYTEITAQAVRQALIDDKGYTDEELPTERTISNLLNRINIKLRRVQKTKPLKKIEETDAIFANINKINQAADNDPHILRISIDTKAKVSIGQLSRGGMRRGIEAPKAHDHDMAIEEKLVPCGILEVKTAQLTTIVGNSAETSDFIVDALLIWWEDRKENYVNIKQLVINMDNGPSIASHRTQFIKRITEFSEKMGVTIHLVYYPPYHSKYNPIERCWGILERHWNGAILGSVKTALVWIKTMTWKGIHPIVHYLDRVYEKGIRLSKKEMNKYNKVIKRSNTLPKWDLIINE